MKRYRIRILFLLVLLYLIFFHSPRAIAFSLPKFSLDFFSRAMENRDVREVFGLEEEEAVQVFGEKSEGFYL